MKVEVNKKIKAGGNNQKLKLFKRGKAISGAPINKGSNQLPKPPMKEGITIKKIIAKACAVTLRYKIDGHLKTIGYLDKQAPSESI